MADRRLQIFHAVATHLNFTRAAEALYMTQPAVTLQIRNLEDEYRMRFFERSPQGVEMTEAGRLMFEYAGRILDLNREMDTRLAELNDEIRGELRIGAAVTLADEVLPGLLGEFNDLYPRVRLVLLTGNSEKMLEKLVDRQIPLALIDGPDLPEGVVAEDCGEDELVLICDATHPLARQKSVTARALADYECLARESGSGTRQVSDAWFAAQGVDPASLKVQMELGSQEALKSLVDAGRGYAIVSRLSVERQTRGQNLRIVPLKPTLRRTFRLAWLEAQYRPRLATAFGEFIQRRLREFYA